MGLFSTKSPVEALQQESTDVINVFTSTVEKLNAINLKADEERLKRVEIIKKAEEEQLALENQIVANKKVVTKIQEFLA